MRNKFISLFLSLIFSAPYLFAKDSVPSTIFTGHYGTTVTFPGKLQITRVNFGEEGDEWVYAQDKEGWEYGLRICSRQARPADNLFSLIKGVRERILRDGVKEGLKDADITELKAPKGYRILNVPKWKMFVGFMETPEYLYQINGMDLKITLDTLEGIKQISRKNMDQLILDEHKKGKAFVISHLNPPKIYKNKIGFSLTVPPGYAMHVEKVDGAEDLYLFPKKHGILVTKEILDNTREHSNFGIVVIQRGRKTDSTPQAKSKLMSLKSDYVRRGVPEKELVLRKADGYWVLENLKSSSHRFYSWETPQFIFIATGVDTKLIEDLIKRTK